MVYFKIENKSMNLFIEKNDYLLIKPFEKIVLNKVYAILDKKGLKILIYKLKQVESAFFLMPDNLEYTSYKYNEKSFEIIGIVHSVTKYI